MASVSPLPHGPGSPTLLAADGARASEQVPDAVPARARWLTEVGALWPGSVLVAVALAVVPSWGAAFAAPKIALLVAGAAVSMMLALVSRRPAAHMAGVLGVAAAVLAASLVGDAVVARAVMLQLAGAGLLVAWTAAGVDVRRTLPLAVGAGTIVAGVAAAQALGLDPLVAFGPIVGGSRLRVYGTLGNPDFVAAFIVPTLALAVTLEPRRPAWRAILLAAVVVQVAALAAARSLATLPSLAVAAIVLMVHARMHGRRATWAAPTLVAAALVAAALLAGRDGGRALQGRLYLWTVAAPHVAAAPLFGHGPGAVEVSWPTWEAAAWSSGRVAGSAQAFAARQDHLHSDYLERAVEQGAAGVIALVVLLIVVLRRALRAPGSSAAGVAAALASLAVRSFVDFPLARPAELCLFALLCATALSLPLTPPEEQS